MRRQAFRLGERQAAGGEATERDALARRHEAERDDHGRHAIGDDERVHAFLKRPLTGEWPYLWLDATYLKVRDSGEVSGDGNLRPVTQGTTLREVQSQ